MTEAVYDYPSIARRAKDLRDGKLPDLSGGIIKCNRKTKQNRMSSSHNNLAIGLLHRFGLGWPSDVP